MTALLSSDRGQRSRGKQLDEIFLFTAQCSAHWAEENYLAIQIMHCSRLYRCFWCILIGRMTPSWLVNSTPCYSSACRDQSIEWAILIWRLPFAFGNLQLRARQKHTLLSHIIEVHIAIQSSFCSFTSDLRRCRFVKRKTLAVANLDCYFLLCCVVDIDRDNLHSPDLAVRFRDSVWSRVGLACQKQKQGESLKRDEKNKNKW